MSRVRRYSRSGLTAPHPRSPTGLSPPAVTRSSGLRLTDVDPARALPPPPAHSFNPPLASPAGYTASRVWAPPRSLAATKGILSVPRGTEMFQFPRCPPRLAPGCPAVRRAGCPIRTSPDHRLPAPPRGISPRGRVLPRPPTPRHPPCAHHADILLRFPTEIRRGRDSRPARASGMVPSGRTSAPLPYLGGPALGTVWFLVWFVCVCVCCSSVRAGELTRAPASHRVRCNAWLGSRHTPSRADTACPGGQTIVPRPQNPTGSAWRIVKVPDPRIIRPKSRQTRRSSRSSNLVRSRSPTSDEISQPPGANVRSWHA